MGAEPVEKLPELLTTGEAAALLRLPESMVVLFAERGLLPAVKRGGEWRLRGEGVQRCLDIRNEPREEFARKFGELLDQMRQALEAAGVTEEDVPRLIEEVRRERRAKRKSTPSRA